MIQTLEHVHLAPDAALVPLDLLLRDDLERDLDGERVRVRAGRGTVVVAAAEMALVAAFALAPAAAWPSVAVALSNRWPHQAQHRDLYRYVVE